LVATATAQVWTACKSEKINIRDNRPSDDDETVAGYISQEIDPAADSRVVLPNIAAVAIPASSIDNGGRPLRVLIKRSESGISLEPNEAEVFLGEASYAVEVSVVDGESLTPISRNQMRNPLTLALQLKYASEDKTLIPLVVAERDGASLRYLVSQDSVLRSDGIGDDKSAALTAAAGSLVFNLAETKLITTVFEASSASNVEVAGLETVVSKGPVGEKTSGQSSSSSTGTGAESEGEVNPSQLMLTVGFDQLCD